MAITRISHTTHHARYSAESRTGVFLSAGRGPPIISPGVRLRDVPDVPGKPCQPGRRPLSGSPKSRNSSVGRAHHS